MPLRSNVTRPGALLLPVGAAPNRQGCVVCAAAAGAKAGRAVEQVETMKEV
jgi:hypothetical protein